jgi:hypothetical protein
MKTTQEIAHLCVEEAVKQGALRRANSAGTRASEAPAFLGPTSPLDGDYEYLASEIRGNPEMLDEDRAFGLSFNAADEFYHAYKTEMAERMLSQTATDFPIKICTAKGSDRFATVEAAAEWLAVWQPSYCDVNGESFGWDPDADEDEMPGVIAASIRAALARGGA